MADFLDEKRRELESRLKDLKPLVEEYHRLEAAVAALAGVGSNGSGGARRSPAASGAPPRKRATARKSSGTGKRGRPKGSGQRGKQALAIVEAQPGVTIPEIADKMGIKQNYLYRVLPGLQQDGMVTKKGKGWYAKTAA
jgi:CRP-like cAMP-binding protein